MVSVVAILWPETRRLLVAYTVQTTEATSFIPLGTVAAKLATS